MSIKLTCTSCLLTTNKSGIPRNASLLIIFSTNKKNNNKYGTNKFEKIVYYQMQVWNLLFSLRQKNLSHIQSRAIRNNTVNII